MARHRSKSKRLRKYKPPIEAKLGQYLAELHLPYKHNHQIGKYSVDYLIDDKFIVECYGDYWHANPQIYPPDYYNRAMRCTAQERWARDEHRRQELQEQGFRFLALWESEIASHAKYCKSKIRHLLTMG